VFQISCRFGFGEGGQSFEFSFPRQQVSSPPEGLISAVHRIASCTAPRVLGVVR
jgi:hypothetical protein